MTVPGSNCMPVNGLAPEAAESAFLAATALLIGNVVVEEKASVWYGCVLRGDIERITVGFGSNIQDLTVCHTDEGIPLTVGKGVTVGHRCVLHGCTIEDDCLIGMGAIIMNGAHVGRGSIIAAGTTIIEKTEIPPFSLVAGIPGKIKKSLPEEETLAAIQASARNYMKLSDLHREGR